MTPQAQFTRSDIARVVDPERRAALERAFDESQSTPHAFQLLAHAALEEEGTQTPTQISFSRLGEGEGGVPRSQDQLDASRR